MSTIFAKYAVVDAPISQLDSTVSALKAQGHKVKVRYFNDKDLNRQKAYVSDSGTIKLSVKRHSTVRSTKAQAKTFSVKIVD